MIDSKNAKRVRGSYDPLKDWVMDPQGYVLIRVTNGLLEAGFCQEQNKVHTIITGTTPQDVYFTACQRGLISRLDHAAYLGKELEKAFLAHQLGIPYTQDEELVLKD